MFWNQLVSFLIVAVATSLSAQEVEGPYKDARKNAIYQQLFCHRLDVHASAPWTSEPAWAVLVSPKPDPQALQKIASDATQQSRIRLLAYNSLRAMGPKVEGRELLGMVMEYANDQGVNLVALYSDGRACAFAPTGHMMTDEEGLPALKTQKEKVMSMAKAVFEQVQLRPKEKLPPSAGNLRLTFLGSDGVRFGEAPIDEFDKNKMAGPLVSEALNLLEIWVRETP